MRRISKKEPRPTRMMRFKLMETKQIHQSRLTDQREFRSQSRRSSQERMMKEEKTSKRKWHQNPTSSRREIKLVAKATSTC